MAEKNVGGVYGSVEIDVKQAKKEIASLRKELTYLNKEKNDLNNYKAHGKDYIKQLRDERNSLEEQRRTTRKLYEDKKALYKEAKGTDAAAGLQKEYQAALKESNKLKNSVDLLDRRLKTLNSNKDLSVLEHSFEKLEQRISKTALTIAELKNSLGEGVEIIKGTKAEKDLAKLSNAKDEAKKLAASFEDVKSNIDLITPKMEKALGMSGFHKSDIFRDWTDTEAIESEIANLNTLMANSLRASRKLGDEIKANLASAVKATESEMSDLDNILANPFMQATDYIKVFEEALVRDAYGRKLSAEKTDELTKTYGPLIQRLKDTQARFEEIRKVANGPMFEAAIRDYNNIGSKMAATLNRSKALQSGLKKLQSIVEQSTLKGKVSEIMSAETDDGFNFGNNSKAIDEYTQKRIFAARKWLDTLIETNSVSEAAAKSEAAVVEQATQQIINADEKKSRSAKEHAEITVKALQRRKEEAAKASADAARLEEEMYNKYESNKLTEGMSSSDIVEPMKVLSQATETAKYDIIDLDNNINLLTKSMISAMHHAGYMLEDITGDRLGSENIKKLTADVETLGRKVNTAESALVKYAKQLGVTFDPTMLAKGSDMSEVLSSNEEFMRKARSYSSMLKVYEMLSSRINAVKSGYKGLNDVIKSTSNIESPLADIDKIKAFEQRYLEAYTKLVSKKQQLDASASKQLTTAKTVAETDSTSIIEENTAAHNKETEAINKKNEALAVNKANIEAIADATTDVETVEVSEAPVVSIDTTEVSQGAANIINEINSLTEATSTAGATGDKAFDTISNGILEATSDVTNLKRYLGDLIPVMREVTAAQIGTTEATGGGQLAPINREINALMAMFRAAAEGYKGVVESSLNANIAATKQWLNYTGNVADYMRLINAYMSGDTSLLNTPDLIAANDALKQMLANVLASQSAVKGLGMSYQNVTNDIIQSLFIAKNEAQSMQDILTNIMMIGGQTQGFSLGGSLHDEAQRARYAMDSAMYAQQYVDHMQRLSGVRAITSGIEQDIKGTALSLNETSANASSFAAQANIIDVEFEDVNESVKKLRLNLKGMIGDIKKVIAPLRGIPEQIERATSEAYGMSNEFKNVANIVKGIVISQSFYAGLSKVKETVTGIVDAFKETESASIAFGSMFSNLEGGAEYVKMLQDFAAVTPFTFTDTTNNARMLAAYGFEAKQILPIMTRLADATAATGDTQSFERVARALGQIRTKGRLLGEEVRQLHEAGIGASAMLQEELGLTEKQMANIGDLKIPAETAITAILRGIEKKFGGTSEALSDSASGMLSTISDNIKLIGMEVSEGAFDSWKEFLTGIRDKLLSAQREMSQVGFGGWLENNFSPETVAILRNFAANFTLMWHSIKSVFVALAPIGKEFLRLVAILSNMVTPVIATVTAICYDMVALFTSSTPLVRLFVQTLGTLLICVTISKAVSMLRSAIMGLAITRGIVAVLSGIKSAVVALGTAVMANPWWLVLIAAGGALAYFAAQSDWFAKASNKISETLNNMWDNSPADYFAPEVEDTTDVMDNFANTNGQVADSLEDVEDAAKKARKAVASFDEVFTLQDETGDDLDVGFDFDDMLGSLDDYLDGIEIPSVDIPLGFEQPDFKILTDGIVENLTNALYGAGIGAVLGGILGGIFGNPLLGAKLGAIAGGLVGFFWDSMSEELQNGIKGAGIGAVVGAAIGLAFGSPLIGAAIGTAAGGIGGFFWDKLSLELQDSVKAAGAGAAVGAVIGTFFGPGLGTALGAVIGAAVSGMGAYFLDLDGMLNNTLTIVSGFGEVLLGVVNTVTYALVTVGDAIWTVFTSIGALFTDGFDGFINEWKDFGARTTKNWSGVWDNLTATTSRGMGKLRETTSAGTKELIDTFDLALQVLPSVTEENTSAMAMLFTENLNLLDDNAISILRGTSDSMAILFKGIKADMSDDEAMKVFSTNLDTMRRTGMTSVDALNKDFSSAMNEIRNNTITYADQMKTGATQIFDALKSEVNGTTSDMAAAVLKNVQDMDSTTVQGLIDMGGSWSEIFSGINADADFSSDDTKNKVVANLTKMKDDGTLNVDNMKNEFKTKFDEMNANSNAQIEQFKSFITTGTWDASVQAGTNTELLKDNIYRAVSQVPGLTATEMTKMANNIVDKLVETGGLSNDRAAEIKNSIINQLGKTPAEAQTKLDELAQKFTNKSFNQLVTDAGTSIGKGFANGLKQALEDFLWNDRWWGKFGNWLSDMFKSSVPTVNIPVSAKPSAAAASYSAVGDIPAARVATPFAVASLLDEQGIAAINTRATISARSIVKPQTRSTASTANASFTPTSVQSNDGITRTEIVDAVITAVASLVESMPTPVYAGTLIADDRSLRQLSNKIKAVETGSKRRSGQ